jgi:CheY-like chemotaxis protein
MAVILGNISFAKISVKPTDKAYERLIEAENATLKGKDLTYKLLTFSRIGESSKTVTSLEGIIRQSAHLGLTGSEVECRFVLPGDLPHVKIDENQMQQVIYNLVVNAKETMPGGGQILITAESTLLGPDTKAPLKSGNYVKISIQDHGSGIPAADMSRIFDPYFTTKEVSNIKGTGLGLAICHGIIRDHNGFMTVDSRPGIGTTVHVYVPVSEEQYPGPRKPQTSGEPLRVLLMDDETAVQQIAAELLGHVGYKVELASEGSQALQMYTEAFKSGKPFDVVIMDLIIPDGMGGAETIRKLRDFDPGVKAIAVSGDTNDKIMENFKEYSFSAAIAKPFSLEEIVMTIESTIADRPNIFAYPVPR